MDIHRPFVANPFPNSVFEGEIFGVFVSCFLSSRGVRALSSSSVVV